MPIRLTLLSMLVSLSVACVGADSPESLPVTSEHLPPEHGEPSDLVEVSLDDWKSDAMRSRFDRNDLMNDAFYLDGMSLSVEDVQLFLEETPYGNRNWMADESFGGRSAAELIIETARAHRINPFLLLSRLQVEQSLISRSERPSQRVIDRAMGCGCFDGQACRDVYLGFKLQLECAAVTMKDRYRDSVEERGNWRRGVARSTLDPTRIVPANHATAALYAYTPWVLERRGGNWLVWNVTLRFLNHMKAQGIVVDRYSNWIGGVCETSEDCIFAESGGLGFCLDPDQQFHGLCTVGCEGYCPDRAGWDGTFCAPDPLNPETNGACVPRAAASNAFCADLEGTTAVEVQRFIGSSRAPAATATVCMP